MAKFLQIGIDINSPLKAKGTSADIPISDALAAELEQFIALYDMGDAKPGDGDAEVAEKFKIKLPFVGNVNETGDFFLHIKTK